MMIPKFTSDLLHP